MDAPKSCRPEDIATVNVHAAKDLLGSSHCYLDVRTPAESCKSHITNASNVPYMFITQEGRVKNLEFLTQVSSLLKKDDLIVVGCNSGGRFLGACVDLLNAGYEDVSNMEGGYSGWVDSGLVGHGKPTEELKNFCKFRP
ncbi:PREDICTED: rhodanese-like domain-containing protein 19, mitochondrial [Theobroma cacao]|uniref:Rhodanese-like domain-containing protein 19, mitochondrial n=1 Tax=Theobroma cacao TaxID=3641 RepID=A0AB32WL64_THECC|nr:PREDICTED: rhodanese-like domain-containing protein 19, mitochondrial [Theobroma cacao]